MEQWEDNLTLDLFQNYQKIHVLVKNTFLLGALLTVSYWHIALTCKEKKWRTISEKHTFHTILL